jgi:hypothetical protein
MNEEYKVTIGFISEATGNEVTRSIETSDVERLEIWFNRYAQGGLKHFRITAASDNFSRRFKLTTTRVRDHR